MKVCKLTAIAVLTSLGSVSFASELYHASNAEEGAVLRSDHMATGLTRAQVQSDVLAAQRNGTLTWISRGYPPRFPIVSAPTLTKTREQVLQEFNQWKMRPVRPDGSYLVPGVGWEDLRGGP